MNTWTIKFERILLLNSENSLLFILNKYRKPTYSSVVLNWSSLICVLYKIALIKCMFYRAWCICQKNDTIFKSEILNIYQILKLNGYPVRVINKAFKEFEKKMKVTLRNNIDNITANQDPVDKDCRLVCLKLPFYNDKMEDFKRKLVKLVRKYYPNVKLNVVFSSPTTIGSFFPFKDKCPASLRSNVVYKLWCEGCDESYIGITQRCIARRMKEHQSKKDSHVFQHLQKCEGPVDFERVEILDTASSHKQLLLKEMVYIQKSKPKINVQKQSALFTLIIGNN